MALVLSYHRAHALMNTLLETYNQDLFLTINALPGTPGWLIDFATFSAEYLIFLLPLMLLIYWFTGGRAERETALFAIVTAITGLTLNFLCSAFYFHPRPFMIRLGHLWIDHAADTSFPSDHGTLFFSITLALWARGNWGSGGILTLVSLLVAWSRIFLGVHFPLDMAGALGVAAVAVIIVTLFWRKKGETLLSCCEAVSICLFSLLPERIYQLFSRHP